jgi:hypothetical protein
MRCALVLLLAGPVLAQEVAEAPKPADVGAARAAMEAQLKAGDELRAKGDLDGALAAYRKAVTAFRETLKKDDGKPAEAKPADPAPAADGTPEGRARVIAYYAKLLGDPSDDVRYNAVATLGEMRAVEARDALLAVLEKDKYQLARRAAAWALGRLGKEGAPAIPALIREVGGEFPLLGYMCDKAVSDITEAMGERATMGFENGMTAEQRLDIQKKWQEWFEKNRAALGVPAEKPADEPAKPAETPPEPAPAEKREGG